MDSLRAIIHELFEKNSKAINKGAKGVSQSKLTMTKWLKEKSKKVLHIHITLFISYSYIVVLIYARFTCSYCKKKKIHWRFLRLGEEER